MKINDKDTSFDGNLKGNLLQILETVTERYDQCECRG